MAALHEHVLDLVFAAPTVFAEVAAVRTVPFNAGCLHWLSMRRKIS
jgi:hypothetical protein